MQTFVPIGAGNNILVSGTYVLVEAYILYILIYTSLICIYDSVRFFIIQQTMSLNFLIYQSSVFPKQISSVSAFYVKILTTFRINLSFQ